MRSGEQGHPGDTWNGADVSIACLSFRQVPQQTQIAHILCLEKYTLGQRGEAITFWSCFCSSVIIGAVLERYLSIFYFDDNSIKIFVPCS